MSLRARTRMSELAEYEQDVRLGWGFLRGVPLNGGVVGVFHNTPTDKRWENRSYTLMSGKRGFSVFICDS